MVEPRWLQERREAAAKEFAALPLPTQEEFWRRTNLKQIKMERFSPLPASQNGALKGSASTQLPIKLLVSGEFLYGEKTSPSTLDNDCLKHGVKLTSLAQAIQENGELVAKYLGKGLQDRHEKFSTQNEAYWQTGAFCYIPKNVSVELPLLIASHFESSGKSGFPRLLVVLDKGAQATLVHYATSESDGDNNFLNSIAEIYVEEGANLTWIDLQSLSNQTYEIALKRVEVGRNSKLKWVMDIQGSKLSKTNIETVLNGEGACAEVLGLVCGSGKQHLELYSLTHHIAPHTTADILVKGTASDQAKTIFQGMIKIEKEAQQTESYMANNNLVLSEKAHADSIPRLEIEADDVKASHGATIGQVDAEQLFYLRARGLNREMAERLLVEGFYEDVFGRVPLEGIRELMRKNLEAKQNAARSAKN
ncbi:MAG: Fe-S cluster assembly protein SufD [Deltaproteobacteria bacterium RIFCSPLOWO2_01_44_7]|nr:MAG: Fe-S cluster assembly protein SufD [Deltaproteobacteria bacterium RIFCSPHIGHO2_01_FULL_43_49]OGQ14479.1 MAG: Fe-S cluster assembly protein SufD [Deltaproteobacteria bacterium RIFCSPHIGHO2_02_FULL_44_53]OGQ27860.1 MAG: Fe-S cluster assembly protein SufD [Deltaproteobacteria bacterium RIFCSPHIGHO2_12_FULL_44_21]OGQ30936.1 MAG: Fe-S cluster assembly protein SufD [Deltaproteobacteria bacterium RIFCSPLOWO2_01_FULL_45_74]OGQ38963.1 MAG: Fe-S cluster assembly protein SufD [Deltaproteobacteria 